jgi:hypothetical protein
LSSSYSSSKQSGTDREFYESDYDAEDGDDDLFLDNVDKDVNDNNEHTQILLLDKFYSSCRRLHLYCVGGRVWWLGAGGNCPPLPKSQHQWKRPLGSSSHAHGGQCHLLPKRVQRQQANIMCAPVVMSLLLFQAKVGYPHRLVDTWASESQL